MLAAVEMLPSVPVVLREKVSQSTMYCQVRGDSKNNLHWQYNKKRAVVLMHPRPADKDIIRLFKGEMLSHRSAACLSNQSVIYCLKLKM